MPSASLKIERVEEFALKNRQKQKIRALLDECFPDYPGTDIYFKQLPSFRYLTYAGKKIVGQLGVDYRIIRNGENICRALCISDVCVSEEYRSQKIGSKMMAKLEKDARKAGIDFIILISNESKMYYHLGYRGRSNIFRWLIIQNHESLGLAQRKLGKAVIMVKKISGKAWTSALTDLLGPIF